MTSSPFLSKLESAPPNYLQKIPTLDQKKEKPPIFNPIFYFFYGTLSNPAQLSHILDLPDPPQFRPAQIVGYSLASWGQYPTLVDGPSGNLVHGVAYEVQTEDHVAKLEHYETKAYEPAPCIIRFTDDGNNITARIAGRTFKYAGDPVALREGRFDRKLWARQMGSELPGLVVKKHIGN